MGEELINNKLILGESFRETIEELGKMNIPLPKSSTNEEFDFRNFAFPPNGELVTHIGEIKKYTLNAKQGEKMISDNISISTYDESINKFLALEGTAYFTSHSLVTMIHKNYIPLNLLTFYFYTRSKEITERSDYIKYSVDPEMDSQKDYIKDKINFLEEYTPSNSILFIDGPLIGGDVYTFMIHAIERFLRKEIIPIFFVKNSTSNLVTDNTKELKYKFNSDMHWAYKFLTPGQRTNFFRYVEKNNPKNAKIFCYLKAFDLSPQRVEFHIATYNMYENLIPSIMDLAYYLILVQGDKKNPQLRPTAISEKYARATLKLINFYKLMRESGLIPTMNQERFGS
ncbi:MAG: DNA double-strand break repair nuclease NurA [Candidatus Jordarchaeum sp.]|uniref:DNA double-strand break repair nuclease NurA n=1 Tax=Candidatus Jordarchaeum sp. TaxID=2823881 RepID=UPI00404B8324